jgi:hypothetical protein
MTPAEQIKAAREQRVRDEIEWERSQREREERRRVQEALLDRDVRPYIRPATARDYNRWLRGYLEASGRITHAYDYPFDRLGMCVAVADFTLPPLYGSSSLDIIVPAGITVVCPDPGHNKLYFMDGFRKGIGGQHFSVSVPVFSDTEL